MSKAQCPFEWYEMERTLSLLALGSGQSPVRGVVPDIRAYLDERVDDSYVGTGIKHFVKVCLSVDQLQLVELFIILKEKRLVSRTLVSPFNSEKHTLSLMVSARRVKRKLANK